MKLLYFEKYNTYIHIILIFNFIILLFFSIITISIHQKSTKFERSDS
jgi:hypothetical protein